MANKNLNIILHLEFQPNPHRLEISGEGVVNYVIKDIGFRAGYAQRKRITQNLFRDLAPIVQRELDQMARQVATMALGINGTNTAPPGSLKITGPIAQSMRGNSGPMTIASVTGQWRTRNKTYLRWKFQNYRTRRWFKNTGKLQSQLGNASVYTKAYGPISVKFIPSNDVAAPSLLGIGRSRGRPSNNIVVGRIEVKAFQKLRSQDLPQIGQKAEYSKKRLSGFADSIQKKLTGKKPKTNYRPVIEPFLTYYINRKIPNAVFRKLEQSLLT